MKKKASILLLCLLTFLLLEDETKSQLIFAMICQADMLQNVDEIISQPLPVY